MQTHQLMNNRSVYSYKGQYALGFLNPSLYKYIILFNCIFERGIFLIGITKYLLWKLQITFLQTLGRIYPQLCAWLLGSFKICYLYHVTLKGREKRLQFLFSVMCLQTLFTISFPCISKAFFSVGQSLLVFFEVSLISSDFLSKSLLFFLCRSF